MSKHVLVYNVAQDMETGDPHDIACNCVLCEEITSLGLNPDDIDEHDEEEEQCECEHCRGELITNDDDDEYEEEVDPVTNEAMPNLWESMFQPTMNVGEQTGPAHVSSDEPIYAPHSSLFGGFAVEAEATPLSPHSDRRGYRTKYGTPLVPPIMDFSDSPMASYRGGPR